MFSEKRKKKSQMILFIEKLGKKLFLAVFFRIQKEKWICATSSL